MFPVELDSLHHNLSTSHTNTTYLVGEVVPVFHYAPRHEGMHRSGVLAPFTF